ncbi:MAG: serine/threonine protein kinase [Candidatus Eisenbacteria bacterium]|nr:serine/threonine protein kinase [Candidatus Eisenbacteria bacterium]
MNLDLGRVAAAFEEALSLSDLDRSAFLQRLASESPALAEEVSALLRSDQMAGDFMASPAIPREGLLVDESEDGSFPEGVLGPYRIVRKLGSGGMSDVYLGERAGEEFTLQVALKIIRVGSGLPGLERRLVAERRVLSTLKHPNIAQLIDGGTTSDGKPYLVMEFVDGEPIDRHCAQRELDLRQRVVLFRTVCDAVAHAHASLVVHRDLKPSNILVDRNGTTKLLDFGIAKLLSGDAERTADHDLITGAQLRLFTPRYASPEQVLGLPTTTTTDVYALGVLLYELLTGASPYGDRADRASLQGAILSGEPTPPSRLAGRTTSASDLSSGAPPLGKLPRMSFGDLDFVVLKALRKDPDARYRSVEALASDLDRYLRGLPVSAAPDRVAYRLRRFLRRNWISASAVSVGLASLLGFAIVTAIQLRETATARDRANREAAVAEQTTSFLEELFRVADPNQSSRRDLTVAQVLDRGTERVVGQLAGQPRVQARLLRTLGSVQVSLGRYGIADSLLRQGVELSRREPDAELELASTLDLLGHCAKQRGRLPEAIEHTAEALGLRERTLGRHALPVAQSLNNLALLKVRVNELAEARELLERAIEIRDVKLGAGNVQNAGTLQNLGNLLADQGEHEAARSAFERAKSAFETDGDRGRMGIAGTLNGLARLASESGSHAEAESLLLRSLTIKRSIYGDSHPAVGTDLSNLAVARKNSGDTAGALAAASEALEIYAVSIGTGHEHYAETLLTVGQLLLASGRAGEAADRFRRALDIFRLVLPVGHPSTAVAESLLLAAAAQPPDPTSR